MKALVLWEVSRKQDYIFSSNKLKENKGASLVIEKVIEEIPNMINAAYMDNLIYNGGGSSLYLFNKEEAKNFIKSVSEKILRDYPGIEIFIVMEEYDEYKDKVTEKIENAYKKLAIKKNRRMNSGAQISFGIERLCSSTGLPAVEEYIDDGQKRYRSAEVIVKLKESESSSKKFDNLLPVSKGINEFVDLAKGEKNYLAIIHIDGNQMGKKFDQLRDYFEYEEGNYYVTNKEYLDALKKFSDEIRNIYEAAFKNMANIVKLNEDKLKDDTKIKEGRFPIIPIILAGDDITYVTNGKIGIETARIFIEYLNKNEIEIYNRNKVKLNACAGVAIVRTSHPFVKSYSLAEDLCSNAKKRRRAEYPDDDYSLIDWHIEQGDLLGNISDIREEHYKTLDNKNLTMRPLYLNNKKDWKSYDNFKIAYSDITNRKICGDTIARNKLKELREIFKKGEKDTEIFLKSNKIDNFFGGFSDNKGNYCFNKDGCMYYDAVEIMDLFVELDGEGERNE